jgi:putative transposase
MEGQTGPPRGAAGESQRQVNIVHHGRARTPLRALRFTLVPQSRRKFLNHTVPEWIRGSPIFFVTLCTSPRGKNQLCQPKIAYAVFSAAEYYHAHNRWHVLLLLLMPDHLHALVSFPKAESMQQVIRSWKHFLSRRHRLNWQRDYFDHRLRSDESHEEKAEYIRQNPVRAGLVSSPELWPYVWRPDR